MGLEMYAFAMPRELLTQPVDFDFNMSDTEQIHYWCKHPYLHGWMENLYRRKGGAEESFNCVPVELTLTDLQELEADIVGFDLPETIGFFFGESDGSETTDDIAFITDAREAISQGMAVFYSSWW